MTKIYDGNVYTIYLDTGKIIELTQAEFDELELITESTYDEAIDVIDSLKIELSNIFDNVKSISKIFKDKIILNKKDKESTGIQLAYIHGSILEAQETIEEFYKGI